MERHQYTPEDIYNFLAEGLKPEYIAGKTGLTISQVYQKLHEYELKYGKIGNLASIIRQGLSPENIVRLYREGTSVGEIARRKGITAGMVLQRIRTYEKTTGESILPERPEKKNYTQSKEARQTKSAPKISMNELKKWIIDLYIEEKKSVSEIDSHIRSKGYKTISKSFILRIISDYTQAQEDLETVKPPVVEKKVEKKNEIKRNTAWIDEEMTNLFLKGMTLASWLKIPENQPYETAMRERLKKLELIAQKAYPTDDEPLPDEQFLELFRIMQNPTMFNPSDGYIYYLRNEGFRLGDYCPHGKITTLRNRMANGNLDLACYILLGLKTKFREDTYDAGVWKSMYPRYEDKVKRYIKRMQIVEKNRAEKAQAAKCNTPNAPEEPEDK